MSASFWWGADNFPVMAPMKSYKDLTQMPPTNPSRSADSVKSLVLVVGAGASYEANLPLGSELKQKIADLLDFRANRQHRVKGDKLIESAFSLLTMDERGSRGNGDSYKEASERIRDAMPLAISIDNFIDAHRTDKQIAECGKLAIVLSILNSERDSLLFVDPSNIYNKLDFRGLEKTWFNPFFQLLTENCQQSSLPARFSQVAIVCFNYDRCIEHYLYHALQTYYAMNAEDAGSTLKYLKIYHPYGIVGGLPWSGCQDSIDFGSTPSVDQLVSLSRQIRTFTEGSDEGATDIVRIRDILANAKRIAFLGFAFHPLNVELLFPRQPNSIPIRKSPIYATGKGISEPDSNVIKAELAELGGFTKPYRIFIDIGATCAKLFGDYRRSLSFK